MKIVDDVLEYLNKVLPKEDGKWGSMGRAGEYVYMDGDMLCVYISYICNKDKELPTTIKTDIMKELLHMVGKTPETNNTITISRSAYDESSKKWIDYVGGIKVLLKYPYDIDKRVTRPSMRALLGLK